MATRSKRKRRVGGVRSHERVRRHRGVSRRRPRATRRAGAPSLASGVSGSAAQAATPSRWSSAISITGSSLPPGSNGSIVTATRAEADGEYEDGRRDARARLRHPPSGIEPAPDRGRAQRCRPRCIASTGVVGRQPRRDDRRGRGGAASSRGLPVPVEPLLEPDVALEVGAIVGGAAHEHARRWPRHRGLGGQFGMGHADAGQRDDERVCPIGSSQAASAAPWSACRSQANRTARPVPRCSRIPQRLGGSVPEGESLRRATPDADATRHAELRLHDRELLVGPVVSRHHRRGPCRDSPRRSRCTRCNGRR